VLGVVLASLGAILMIDRTDVGLDGVGRLWPVMLIAAGLAHFLGPQPDLPHGFGLIATGLWLLVVTLTPLRLAETWPVMMVVLGVVTMWRALPPAAIAKPRDGGDDVPGAHGEPDVR
jgi:hypothetical protein